MKQIYKTKFIILIIFSFTIGKIFSQDSLGPPENRKVRMIEKTVVINASPKEVFDFMDDINNTGMHMTKTNPQMMGSKLNLEWLTDHKTGLNTQYKWTGKVVGMKMKFTVVVTGWESGRSKTWETIGKAKMIVISWYRMYLELKQNDDGTTTAKLGILYTRSKSFLGFLLGKRYSMWCVNSMLNDTQKHFNKNK